MTRTHQTFYDITFTARDGLRLYGRHYPATYVNAPKRRPVLCLPGLTRNSRDFHVIAEALAHHPEAPRDVYTLDYRGRGLSEYDPEWRNYAVPVEAVDVLDYMTVTGTAGASIIGTSRGGLIAMVMAAMQPRSVGPVVLNDIGPVIDQTGLGRISAYVGRIPLPSSWKEAGALVHDMGKRAFPSTGMDECIEIGKQWFNEHKGRPAPGYDPALSNALSVLDGPIPELWPQFEALKRVPCWFCAVRTPTFLPPPPWKTCAGGTPIFRLTPFRRRDMRRSCGTRRRSISWRASSRPPTWSSGNRASLTAERGACVRSAASPARA
jgi:pimeloyl-ACP methyl ester carboxylesterase